MRHTEIVFSFWLTFSDLDYGIFLRWLGRVRGFLDHDRVRHDLYVYFDLNLVDAHSLDQLLVLFNYYSAPLCLLLKLKTEKNEAWFDQHPFLLQVVGFSKVLERKGSFKVNLGPVKFLAKYDREHFFSRLQRITFVLDFQMVKGEVLLSCEQSKILVPDLFRIASLFRRYRVSTDYLLPFLSREQQQWLGVNKDGEGACFLLREEMLVCLANNCSFDSDCNAKKL